MANVFSDYGDVSKTREIADRTADQAASGDASDVSRVVCALDALRYEIRAAAQTVSSAIGAAVEELRGEMRGER